MNITRHILVIVMITVIAGATVYATARIVTNHVEGARGRTGETTQFEIESNESVDSIAERLHNVGLIRSPSYFLFRAQMTGQDQQIVAGNHELNTAMTVSQILDVITSEDAISIEEVTVRFTEGWRVEQYGEALVAAGLISSVDEFLVATHSLEWDTKFNFLHTRPSGVGLEGYLFPDTYNFRTDVTPEDIIEILLQNFEERVPPDLQASANALGLTLHQAVTLASIVERETSLSPERPLIASVYFNRLLAGMPLQADPTIQYARGTSDNWWPLIEPADLQTQGPYNTYLNPNLPPGPICNPGLDSITSAFGPAQTDYLYFVSTGSDSHAFAITLEEHEANVELYQQEETATP